MLFVQFQELIVGGHLPCSKEEAAVLASIQLRIEENWPVNKRRNTIQSHMMRGHYGAVHELTQKILVTPWEVDPASLHNSYVPFYFFQTFVISPSCFRENPLMPRNQQQKSIVPTYRPIYRQHPRRFHTYFTRCIEHPELAVNHDVLVQCLPPAYRDSGRIVRYIKVTDLCSLLHM